MRVGVVQMTSALEPEANLLKLKYFFDEAETKGCDAVFLPEVFFSKGMGTSQTPYIVSYENEHYENLLNLFKELPPLAALPGPTQVSRL